jgi:ribonuclease HI
MNPEAKVRIYTDGACSGNPGPGGYGVVLLHGEKRREIAGGYRWTTNNRMEMMAVIVGLRALRFPCAVTLYTDSRYLADGIEKGWAVKWRENGWIKSDKKPALNPDLWEELLELLSRHAVKVVWLKGHAGHAENEKCDRLSVQALKGAGLSVDEAYERGNPFKRLS